MYRTNIYLGVDSLIGKKVQTTATATTRKMCDIKANSIRVASNLLNVYILPALSSYKLDKINSILFTRYRQSVG